jgi:hypothetical protein
MGDFEVGRLIQGRELRYLLTVVLVEADQVLTVADLVDRVQAEGFVFARRPSKVVSDALRWELRRGRVVRHGRGCYGPGSMPRQTRSRIRQRVAALRRQVPAPAPGSEPAIRPARRAVGDFLSY